MNLDDVAVAVHADDETLLAVNEALEKFEREDPDAAQLIKLREKIGEGGCGAVYVAEQ